MANESQNRETTALLQGQQGGNLFQCPNSAKMGIIMQGIAVAEIACGIVLGLTVAFIKDHETQVVVGSTAGGLGACGLITMCASVFQACCRSNESATAQSATRLST